MTNEQLKELVFSAGGYVSLAYEHDGQLILSGEQTIAKFVEVIKQALYNNVCAWRSSSEELTNEPELSNKHWSIGYDSGITDALCEIVNFGVNDVRE